MNQPRYGVRGLCIPCSPLYSLANQSYTQAGLVEQTLDLQEAWDGSSFKKMNGT